MIKYWRYIPVWIQVIIIAVAMLIPIVTVIQYLIVSNVRVLSDLPWSIVLVLVLLAFYWQYVTGRAYPFGASDTRAKLSLSKWPIEQPLLQVILLSSVLLVFVFSTNSIGFAYYGTEGTVQFEFIAYVSTAGDMAPLLFLALALTAGLVEEIVFRGYIQSMLLSRYSPIITFVCTGLIFTAIHFLPFPLWPFYFLVSVAFSWVAYSTQSIIPCIIVHALFDFLAFLAVHYDLDLSQSVYMQDTILQNIVITIIAVLSLYFVGSKLRIVQKQS